MTKKMLIDAANEEEVRVCLLEGGKVEDFDFESAARKPLRGNIYLARVTRVEPSLQAAFVEYGGNRHGFLAFNEIHPDYYQIPVSDREKLREVEQEEARLAALLNIQQDADEDDPQGGFDDPDLDSLSSDSVGEDDEDDDDRGDTGADTRADTRSGDRSADAVDRAGDDHDDNKSSRRSSRRRTRGGRRRRGQRDHAENHTEDGPSAPARDARSDADDVDGTDDTLEVKPDRDVDGDGDADMRTEDGAGAPDVAALENEIPNEASDEVPNQERADTEALPTENSDGDGDEEPARPKKRKTTRKRRKSAPSTRSVEEEEEEEDTSEDDDDDDSDDFEDGDDESADDDSGVDDEDDDIADESDFVDEDTADYGSDSDPDDVRLFDDEDEDISGSAFDEDDSDEDEDDEDDDDDDDASNDDALNGQSRAVLLEQYREARRQRARLLRGYKIQEVIKRRQILLIQVVKEERGNKGAALTTYLSLAGRYCVLMPNTARGGGISRKIANGADRKRLRRVVGGLDVPQGMGLIIRTAGSKRTKSEIKRDYDYLSRLWENIRELTLKSIAPCLIYEEASLIKRAIRDLYDKDISQVLVDGETGYREAKDFMKMLMPSHAKNVQPYKEPTPLFVRYDVEQQLDAMYKPEVRLKSGGYLVINQTEALIAIDVNSGKATRERNIEQTALKTNLEAAREVARQCRLRDLAGLLVIDFIDMEENRNNRAVEKRLKDSLKDDRARIQVGRISSFGLLEMSRQRRRSGIVDGTTHACPACNGAGVIRSNEMAALRVLRAAEAEAVASRVGGLRISTSSDVVLYILNHKRDWLARIEQTYDVSIDLTIDSTRVGDSFNIVKTGPERQRPARPATARADFSDADDADEQSDAARSEPSDDGSAEDTDDRSNQRKSRRRKRRGDPDDRPSRQHAQSGDDSDDTDSDPSSGDASDNDDAQASGDDDGDRPKKRRRRGRRGGRRNRRNADHETDQNAQSETQSETQAETQSEIQSETQAETQSEIQSEIQSEPGPEADQDAAMQAAPDLNDETGHETPTADEKPSEPAITDAAADGDAPVDAPEAEEAEGTPDATVPEQASEQASEQAAEKPSEQAPEPADKPADKPAKKARKGWWQRAL